LRADKLFGGKHFVFGSGWVFGMSLFLLDDSLVLDGSSDHAANIQLTVTADRRRGSAVIAYHFVRLDPNIASKHIHRSSWEKMTP